MKRRLAIAIAVLALAASAALAWWMQAQCHVPVGRAAIKASNSIGCFEFWFNRYQTAIIGAVTTIVAIVAAALLLKQLRAMAEQNSVARAALEITKAQIGAQEKQHLARAIDVIDQLSGQFGAAAFSIANNLVGRSLYELATEFQQTMTSTNSLRAEYKKTVLPVLETARELSLYRQTEDLLATASRIFFTEFANQAGEYYSDIAKIAGLKAGTKDEAVACVGRISLSLRSLRQELEKRLDLGRTS